ncbi:MAG: UDP-3-O-[3-hydroxymyristoyl] glucosamine N-acyltransferase [Cellvibrionaceae bacterium]|jgi:UDP-3-O-[3-hydroxymyristoyl] glucosamine N-acyltransferase
MSEISRHRFTLAELATYIHATYIGDPQRIVDGLATLRSAQTNDLAFYTGRRYSSELAKTEAGVVLLHPDECQRFEGEKLLHINPYLAYAQLTALFSTEAVLPQVMSIHPSASIAEGVCLGEGVNIGSHVTIESGARIGDHTIIGAGCYLGRDTSIGEQSRLYPNVSIYRDVSIGKAAVIHSGAVIGADGFGFAKTENGWQKIYQLGGVIIGDGVEIGANTCIDRGALDDTYIASGVKIDNQVQIAHNVRVGENTAIAGATAIAGSTKIGKNCTIAGAVGIVGHLSITDGVHITAMSLVTKSIDQSGSYSSGVPLNNTQTWRKNAARFNQLDALVRRLQPKNSKV